MKNILSTPKFIFFTGLIFSCFLFPITWANRVEANSIEKIARDDDQDGNQDTWLEIVNGETVTNFHWDIIEIKDWDEFDDLIDLQGFVLKKGSNADAFLASLFGGVAPPMEIAFDNTMFPDVPGSGFTTSTNGRTEFRVTFDTPLPPPPSGEMAFDLSGIGAITVSTTLDLNDPSMVEAFLINTNGALFQVKSSSVPSVPEPTSSLSFLALGTLGVGSAILRKKRSIFDGD